MGDGHALRLGGSRFDPERLTLTNGQTGMIGDFSKEQGGGGAWCQRGGVVSNCWVLGNSATRDGGGIHGGTVLNCLIAGNRAGDDGGGADGSRLTNCVLRGNTAANGGGGADESWLEKCTVTENYAPFGAGVDDATLIDCTISRHAGYFYAGGVDAVFVGCNILSNSAVTTAGVGGSMVDRCIIKGNVATARNGGAEGCVLANSLIAGNIAANQAGGLYLSLAYNCTVALNEADSGGGVLDSGLHNSIVYFNEGGNYQGSSFSNSCTIPLPTDIQSWRNIDDDPHFVSLLGGDFRLRPDSPCIDAGGWPDVASRLDLDGNPRFVDDNAPGYVAVDLGAYEFQYLRFIAVYRNGANVVLVWNTARYVTLEASAALAPASWSEVPEATGRTTIELPSTGASRFFRLVQNFP